MDSLLPHLIDSNRFVETLKSDARQILHEFFSKVNHTCQNILQHKSISFSDVKLMNDGYVVVFKPGKQKGPIRPDRFLIPRSPERPFYLFSKYVEQINQDLGHTKQTCFWFRGNEASNGKRSKLVDQVIEVLLLYIFTLSLLCDKIFSK